MPEADAPTDSDLLAAGYSFEFDAGRLPHRARAIVAAWDDDDDPTPTRMVPAIYGQLRATVNLLRHHGLLDRQIREEVLGGAQDHLIERRLAGRPSAIDPGDFLVVIRGLLDLAMASRDDGRGEGGP